MSIPGSAVTVERLFSGGRDTISLRCSRSKPEAIRTLILVKHHLCLKRKNLEDAPSLQHRMWS
ncbi:hypothetical protein B0H16DRAFT_1425022 [Mycena metata]|uniref:HAT C-terminal dimerisation domain-containing protein n=1 Tax=Mycena metata TaxID=1033252 RepID=A0AAD7MYX8_9AGAR|nr:hypothetical protein B0H16DRAFT_1425022 [Mycena metata]